MSASNRTKIGGPTGWTWGVLICAVDTTPSGDPTSWEWDARDGTLELVPTGTNDNWDWTGANCTLVLTTTTTSTTSTSTSTTSTTSTTMTTTTSTTSTTSTTTSTTLAPTPTTPPPVIYTETRYMRSDLYLGTSQSTFMDFTSASKATDDSVFWAIKVFKSSGGVETQIDSGYCAIVMRSTDGVGIQSTTWTPPLTSIWGCSIIVRVYIAIGATWYPAGSAVFDSYALGADYLLSNTWTVYYSTQRSYSGGNTNGYFYFGSFSYNSRITGFQYQIGG